jgi:hypothetical protein
VHGFAHNPRDLSRSRARLTTAAWRRELPPIRGYVVAVCLLGFILAAAPPARAQVIKLYLKDGSYQLVKTYKVQGNKIHYYNLDTSEWEDMPVSLVDFDATKRAQEQEAVVHEEDLEKAKTLEKERFDPSITPSKGFAVAPGRFLPSTEGVYAYDGLRVVPLVQSQGEIVTDKDRMVLNMAIPMPLLKKRALVTLPGAEAAVRIENPQPVFYIQSNDDWGAKAEFIPVKSSRNVRVVERIQSGLGAGASGEVREDVPMERTQVAKGIVKLQPAKPLEPGEYAIGELTDGKLNLEVWDFGIDRPGKKAPTPGSEAEQGTMSERRPGDNTPQVTPADVIPGIPHPHQTQPSPPSPGPDSAPSTPTPPNSGGPSGPSATP